MKYLRLIWAGMWRRPGRTALMLLQILVAFLLFGLLQGMQSGINQAIDTVRADLYRVSPAEGGTPLPLALQQRISSVPGVRRIYGINVFIATYQRPSQQLGVLATNFDAGWISNFDVSVPRQVLAALAQMRTGALVSRRLAEKYGWKAGDRIPLQSHTRRQDGSTDWTFDDVGTFDAPSWVGVDNVIIVRDDYYESARLLDRDTAAQYTVLLADPHQGEQVARRIDALSANSSFETRTQSVRALAQSNLQSLGDLNFIVRSIVAAAMFALLVSTAAMLMQSVRERTTELAVLKTIGFSDLRIFGMLLAESVLLSLGATALGLAAASRILPLTEKFLNLGITIPDSVVLAGFLMAVVFALASAILPAWRGLRLQVAAALAGR
ncbi:MAG TPA: FtsX-like permease family protein [Steroidobacteraceae bacterium]|nr:FtsX-like permease family protein [Steroidobacteraceae bacterium]